jgi:hypothetical protein
MIDVRATRHEDIDKRKTSFNASCAKAFACQIHPVSQPAGRHRAKSKMPLSTE